MSRLLKLHGDLVDGRSPRATTVLLLFLLTPLSWCYGLVNLIRVLLFQVGARKVFRSRVPVVSVGNLAVGGTGKTPMVDFLVRFWLDSGKRVAVVSRGYKSEGGDEVRLVTVDSSAQLVGDEPLLLARRNPDACVLVAKKRRYGIEQAVDRHGAEVVILDDGFQHLQVARSLDIVLVDAARPFGNGLPLPAGNLREFPSALKRADLLIHTRCDDHKSLIPDFAGPQFHSTHRLDEVATCLTGETFPLKELRGKRIVAFAGIAKPERFFASLVEAGLELTDTIPLPDHVYYCQTVIDRLIESANGADYLLTTEKDGVKLMHITLPVTCLTVGMTLKLGPDREELVGQLEKLEI